MGGDITDSHGDFGFVVVIMHGAQDVSRATFQSADEALRYMERLRQQYASEISVSMYHTRLARTAFQSG